MGLPVQAPWSGRWGISQKGLRRSLQCRDQGFCAVHVAGWTQSAKNSLEVSGTWLLPPKPVQLQSILDLAFVAFPQELLSQDSSIRAEFDMELVLTAGWVRTQLREASIAAVVEEGQALASTLP